MIPAAKQVPTAWNGSRYLRIGSSKVNLNKYPERESRRKRHCVKYDLEKGILPFSKSKTFERNLELQTQDGKYILTGLRFYREEHLHQNKR